MSRRASSRAADGGPRRASSAKSTGDAVSDGLVDEAVTELLVAAEASGAAVAVVASNADTETEGAAVVGVEPVLDDHEVVAEDLEVAETVGEHPAPGAQREAPRLAADVDEQLVVRLAREALAEVTPERTIGALRDVTINADEAAAIVRFSTTQGGYPGWFWTIAVSAHEGVEPSVLEVELLPYEGALTAPEWVPWADRLEDYVAQQEAEAAERKARGDVDADADDEHDETGDEFDDESLDDAGDESDDDDDDVHEHDLHLDDVDGVDIDLHGDDEEE